MLLFWSPNIKQFSQTQCLFLFGALSSTRPLFPKHLTLPIFSVFSTIFESVAHVSDGEGCIFWLLMPHGGYEISVALFEISSEIAGGQHIYFEKPRRELKSSY